MSLYDLLVAETARATVQSEPPAARQSPSYWSRRRRSLRVMLGWLALGGTAFLVWCVVTDQEPSRVLRGFVFETLYKLIRPPL